MDIKFDTHTHTIASTHAYSTVTENAAYAARIGMDGFAVTDHAPAMPDAPHVGHFHNLCTIPRDLCGLKILLGAELNILDMEGHVDLDDWLLERFDVVNASIHPPTFKDGPDLDCTRAYEAVVKNPLIDIICHSGYVNYSYDYEYIVKLAKEHNKLLEINNHTYHVRKASIPNCKRIAELCKKHGTGIVVASDAHMYTDIGDYSCAMAMLEEIDFPEELVMNTSYGKFAKYLREKRGKEPMRWRND